MKVTCDKYGEAVELIRILWRNANGAPVCVNGKWIVDVLAFKQDPTIAHDRKIKAVMLWRWRGLSHPGGLASYDGNNCPIWVDHCESCEDCPCNCFAYWHQVRAHRGDQIVLAKEILEKVKKL